MTSSIAPTWRRAGRKRWKTRVELANTIFEYLEAFHNRQRRHSALGMRQPVEYEAFREHGPAA